MPINVAILVSGNGSNLQAIIDANKNDFLNINISCVIANIENCFALKRADKANITNYFIDHKLYQNRDIFDNEINKILQAHNIDLICLAGFMRIIGQEFINIWDNKIINIHPSILPSFKGINAIEQALNYGVKYTGCTVHYVNEEVDSGQIIDQSIVEVTKNDTIESLSKKIHNAEHILYPRAIKSLL
ncbi:MAG: phosphoribosylglycinamide formyltransferase [Pseudomonadota bacterium]